MRKFHRLRFYFVPVILNALMSVLLHAAPPSIGQLFRVKESTATSSALSLTTEHGPWLIHAYTFQGEDAEKRATELANELRSSYGLRAYIYAKSFDFTEVVPGSGIDPNGKQKRMRYANDSAIECFAVLVGDFASADSPNYDHTLKIIKFANPKSLGGDGSNPGASMKESLGDLRKLIGKKASSESKMKPGKMGRAIGTSNPALPKDFMQPPKVDNFVKGLNAQVEHSLLDNPKRFTVRVATFRGEDNYLIGSQSANKEDADSQADQSGLEKAAELANTAAKLLRSQGIEAYQFHERNLSIVTVGGFDSIGQSGPDGSFSYAPEIVQVMTTFGGVKEIKGSQYGNVPTARTLLDVIHYKKIPELNRGTEKEKKKWVKKYSIPLELTPTVMAVPRPEAKSLFAGFRSR